MAKIKKTINLLDVGNQDTLSFLVNKNGAIALLTDPKGKIKPVGITSIDEFQRAVTVDKPFKSELLPPNLLQLYSYTKNNILHNLFVFQYKPQIRNINLNHPSYDEKQFSLAFPYVQMFILTKFYDGQWVADNHNCYCTISPTQITSEDNEVYHTPIHNVYDTGAICWGRSPIQIDGKAAGIVAYATVNNFWNSKFNDHYPHVIENYSPIEINNYNKWSKLSSKPTAIDEIVKLKYVSHGLTLKQYIQNCFGAY